MLNLVPTPFAAERTSTFPMFAICLPSGLAFIATAGVMTLAVAVQVLAPKEESLHVEEDACAMYNSLRTPEGLLTTCQVIREIEVAICLEHVGRSFLDVRASFLR